VKFSSEFIEQVRQANDIVSVISDYVTLKRRGRNFWACCPFHNEKTASFSVAPDKGFFYCFGCHASGDVFKFIMMKENLTFGDAVTRLAERAHMVLPAVEKSAQEIARDKMTAQLYQVIELASNFYHNCLIKTHYGQPGLDYFHKRHLTDQTILDFKLGYAPDSWNKLTDAFLKKGIAGKTLVTLGLSKEKNGRFYDAFRNRVMFPIRDGRGRVVGFGGRVLDDSKPKYLNSPETPIFNKRRLLFAMDRAHKTIYEAGKAVLVEGYMDVIAAHNRGVTNVVASLGTAFTTEQARLLQRQAKELVLSYDMDSAGRNATLRAMEIVRGLGMRIRVVSLPQGKDPDEYINASGADAFRAAVDSAPNVLDYMLQTALQQFDSSTLEGKASVTAMVMPALAAVDNRIILEAFLAKVAQQLQIDANAVRSEFNKYVSQHPEANQKQVRLSKDISDKNATARGIGKMAVAEENILRFLLEKPESCERIQGKINLEFFTNEKRRSIYRTILEIYEHQGMYNKADIQEKLTPEEAEELARIMVLEDIPMDESVLMDYVKRFRLADLQKQYEEHSKRAAEMSRTGNTQFVEELKICKRIKEQMKEWS
jgi:DNA primase